MVRKAKERQRINQQRHRKLKNESSASSKFSPLGNLFPAKFSKVFYKATERCFNLVGYYCCQFCFAPISVNDDGKFLVTQNPWKLRRHNGLLTLHFTWVFYQLVSLVNKMAKGVVDLEMVLCMTTFAASIVGVSVSSSALLKRHETVQMLNTLPTIMQYHPNCGEKVGLFESFKLVLVVLGLLAVTSVIAIFTSLLNLMVPSLPGSLS